jgi:hypothetical protein
MSKRLLLWILCIFLCYAKGYSHAQTEQAATIEAIHTPILFDAPQIAEYKKDPAFDYTPTIKSENTFTRWKEKLKRQIQDFFADFFQSKTANSLIAFLLQIIPYLFVFLASFALLWWVLKLEKGRLKDAKMNMEGSFKLDDATLLAGSDLDILLKQALSEENYRQAVRLKYLKILKKLMDKQLIHWRAEKTNSDYINELPKGPLKLQFGQLTRAYNYIWYGQQSVDSDLYQSAESSFQQMETLL